MFTSVSMLPQQAAKEYVQKMQREERRNSPMPSATLTDSRPYTGREGDVVTVHRNSGMKPFTMRWKNAPRNAARLKSQIAQLEGKIDRMRIKVDITDKERAAQIASYTCEMRRAKKSLCSAYAGEREYVIVVES